MPGPYSAFPGQRCSSKESQSFQTSAYMRLLLFQSSVLLSLWSLGSSLIFLDTLQEVSKEYVINVSVVNDLAEREMHLITKFVSKCRNKEERKALLPSGGRAQEVIHFTKKTLCFDFEFYLYCRFLL